jgi:hypothetical protein
MTVAFIHEVLLEFSGYGFVLCVMINRTLLRNPHAPLSDLNRLRVPRSALRVLGGTETFTRPSARQVVLPCLKSVIDHNVL